jgi:hypothetical protein
MIRPSRWLSGVLASAVLMNTVAFAGVNTSGVQALQGEVKNFRTAIDLGRVSPQDAIDNFAKAIADKNVSVDDVNTFVKGRLSPREYQAFRQQMDAALAGIDVEKVTGEELGEIVGQALSKVGSEGLSWGSCASTWTGVGVIVAAVVVGIFAIIKSKSTSAIQKDYLEQRNSESARFTDLIDRSANWETRIPADIIAQNNQLQQDYYQLEYYRQQAQFAQTQEEAQMYYRYMQDYQQSIYYRTQAIIELQSLWTRYLADPSLSAADVASYTAQMETRIAELLAQEAVAVAEAPANQRLGRNLGIGAGVGAAAGTYLLVRGIREGGC